MSDVEIPDLSKRTHFEVPWPLGTVVYYISEVPSDQGRREWRVKERVVVGYIIDSLAKTKVPALRAVLNDGSAHYVWEVHETIEPLLKKVKNAAEARANCLHRIESSVPEFLEMASRGRKPDVRSAFGTSDGG